MTHSNPGRDLDPEWHEREYNPRVLVPHAAEIMAAWSARAETARRRRPPLADIRYGEHPREVLDLFRADAPHGTVLFIHGGYWRALSKDEFSWVAEGFLAQGLSVALPYYPLSPQVPLARILTSAPPPFAHLSPARLSEDQRPPIA